MRIAAQILTIFLVCFAGYWLLNQRVRSRPTLISGKVIDWSTGQAAPHTDVRRDELNFSQIVARTDAHGQFTFAVPHVPDAYFLFAGAPRYGRLLQTTFGRTVVVYRPGEQVRNLVIPAIPAPELSGHVYAADGHPISGCDVAAITRDNSESGNFVDLSIESVQAFTYGIAQADDPNKFVEVDTERTDPHGSYTFKQLGADRYFVLARCQEVARGKEKPRFSWEPMAYPQATSIISAQEIVLLPGEHRSGIDFHVQRKRSYAVEGKVIFSDSSTPKPWPQAVYSHDVQMFRLDRALTSTWLGNERCDWDANAGTFSCYSLLPGTYTLYFDLSGVSGAYKVPTQFAQVSYTVQAAAKQLPLTVQLHNVPNKRSLTPKTGSSGFLDLRNICETAVAGRADIEVLAWGHGRGGGMCSYMTAWGKTRLSLPEDTYTVNAFEAAFVRRKSSYLGRNSKFEAFMMQHGIPVHIHVGQTSEAVLPVLTTNELIGIALESLRAGH